MLPPQGSHDSETIWKTAQRFGLVTLVAITFVILAVTLISPTAVFLSAKLDPDIASDGLAIGRENSSAIQAKEVAEEVADVMWQQTEQALQPNVSNTRDVTKVNAMTTVNASDGSDSDRGSGSQTRESADTVKEKGTSQIATASQSGDASSAHQITEVDSLATRREDHRSVNDTFYESNEFVGSSEPNKWLLKAEDKEKAGGQLAGSLA